MEKIWMNEMSWKEVDEYLKGNQLVLVPIGSTEQHGPAAPLGLDTYVATALTEDVARQTGTIATPPMWFGDSPHHLAFPGTISIRTETLAEYVKDVIRSLARHGFKKIVIINGHKITNLAPLTTAVRNVKEFEFPELFLAIVDPIKVGVLASKIKEKDEHHAGELEISHMLYKYPRLIERDKIPKGNPEFNKLYSGYMQSDLFASGVYIDIAWSSGEEKRFSNEGALSDATKASAEKGKEFHEAMVREIVNFIEWLKVRK